MPFGDSSYQTLGFLALITQEAASWSRIGKPFPTNSTLSLLLLPTWMSQCVSSFCFIFTWHVVFVQAARMNLSESLVREVESADKLSFAENKWKKTCKSTLFWFSPNLQAGGKLSWIHLNVHVFIQSFRRVVDFPWIYWETNTMWNVSYSKWTWW